MPSPKRWCNLSQDLNRDPEVWALTDEFGDRTLRILIEVFAILERCDNRWIVGDVVRTKPYGRQRTGKRVKSPTDVNWIPWVQNLARIVRCQPATTWLTILKMESNGWLEFIERFPNGLPRIIRASKWRKYHPKWEAHQENSGGTEGASDEATVRDSFLPSEKKDKEREIKRGSPPQEFGEKQTGFQPISEVAQNVLDMAKKQFGRGTSPGTIVQKPEDPRRCEFWRGKRRVCLLPASEREGLFRCQWHAYLEVCPVLEARAGGGTLEQFTAWLTEYKPYETRKRPSDLWDLANVSG